MDKTLIQIVFALRMASWVSTHADSCRSHLGHTYFASCIIFSRAAAEMLFN